MHISMNTSHRQPTELHVPLRSRKNLHFSVDLKIFWGGYGRHFTVDSPKSYLLITIHPVKFRCVVSELLMNADTLPLGIDGDPVGF